MRKWGIQACLKWTLFFIVASLVMGGVVMKLWNWLLPDLLSLKPISFVQALGLLLLCRILFGGFGGGKHHHCHEVQEHKGGYWGKKFREKLENMSPEEREKFREKYYSRCGWYTDEQKKD